MKSLKVKVGGRVIEFKKNSAVFCEAKDSWDFDFKELKDGWIHCLESEKGYRYYLRVIDNSKSIKVLYFQAMYIEDGEFQSFSLDPLVVWITNEDYSQGIILQYSYLFQNEMINLIRSNYER